MKKLFLSVIQLIKSNKILLVVFLLALVVRLWGVRYGLPIIFNIDEPSFVRSVNGLRFSLNPGRFDWPHTHMYLHFFFYLVFYYGRVAIQILGLRPVLESFFPLLWQDPQVFYFLSRLLNAVIGALTIFPVYLASKELLKSKKLALMTVTLFAFIPFAVEDSHRALLDTGMAFWVSLSFLFMVKILSNPSTKNYLYSGLFLGLAFGTKYNALFYWLVFAIIILIANRNKDFLNSLRAYFSTSNVKKYLVAFFSFIFAWIITNPTVITDFDLFWSKEYGRGFLFQFENVGSKTWQEYPVSLFENLVSQSISDYGLTLYIAIAVLVIAFLFFCYRNRVILITLFVPIVMYFYISSKDRNPSHYFIFLYPLISIAVVKFISDISNNLNNFYKVLGLKTKVSKDTSAKFLLVLFLLIMVSPVIGSIRHSYLFSRKDTRNLAYEYFQENLTEQDLVYYYRGELEQLPDKPYDYKKLVRVDLDNVDTTRLPFYLFIGVNEVSYEDLMEGDRDTNKIEGNVSRFIKNSELVFYDSGENRLGPPVFIFKVYEVESSN